MELPPGKIEKSEHDNCKHNFLSTGTFKIIPAKHPNSQVGNAEELVLVGNQSYGQPVL